MTPNPQLVSNICYDLGRPETPWTVIRVGTVAGQGGLSWGHESSSFPELSEALGYLEACLNRDIEEIKQRITQVQK